MRRNILSRDNPLRTTPIGGSSRWRWRPLVDACQCLRIARDLVRTSQETGPGTARMVAFVCMHLGINEHHDGRSCPEGPAERMVGS